MIIPCMNSTSFVERGGSIALDDDGNVRVGCPGAPGWTTFGSDPWAEVIEVIKRTHKPARRTGENLKQNNRIAVLDKTVSAYQKNRTHGRCPLGITGRVNTPFRLSQVTVTQCVGKS